MPLSAKRTTNASGAFGPAQHARLGARRLGHQLQRALDVAVVAHLHGDRHPHFLLEYEWLSTVVVTSVSLGTMASTPSRLRTTT